MANLLDYKTITAYINDKIKSMPNKDRASNSNSKLKTNLIHSTQKPS